jgi:hypothetical protein
MERSRGKDKKRARGSSPDSEVEYVEEKPKAPDIIKISDSESDYSGSEEEERGPLPECHLLLNTTKCVAGTYTAVCEHIALMCGHIYSTSMRTYI